MNTRDRILAIAARIDERATPDLLGRVFTTARGEDQSFLDAVAPAVLVYLSSRTPLKNTYGPGRSPVTVEWEESYEIILKLISASAITSGDQFEALDLIEKVESAIFGYKHDTTQTPFYPVGQGDFRVYAVDNEADKKNPYLWYAYAFSVACRLTEHYTGE